MNAIVPANSNAMVPTSMEGAMRLAEMMARGKLVPNHLHNSPGDCLMIIEQSMRWGMSPFAVAQCTSVIQGKLMFEGKLVSAALHSSGIMASRLEYEFNGTGDSRAIVVRGTLKGESQPREFPMTLKEAKTSNGMWVKQPDQQLVYAATRGWARRHAPEVMLGVYAPEEFDAVPTRPEDTFTGTTLEAKAEAPVTPAAAPGRKVRDILDEIGQHFAIAIPQGREAVDEVLASEDVQKALDKFVNGAQERLQALITDAITRTAEPEADAPDDLDATNIASMVARVAEATSLAAITRMKARTNAGWKAEYDLLSDAGRAQVDAAIEAREAELRANT